MASKRATLGATALLLIVAGLATFGSPRLAAAQPAGNTVEVIGLPRPEAKKLFARVPMRLGLGVYPPQRDWVFFLHEIGFGAPPEARVGVGNRVSLFAQAIQGMFTTANFDGSIPPSRTDRLLNYLLGNLANAGIHISASGSSADSARVHAAGTLEPQLVRPRPLSIAAFETADEVERRLRAPAAAVTIVIELGGRTPTRIGMCEGACASAPGSKGSGLLTGSITRRPGIITAYDISATILDRLDIPIPEGFAGNILTANAESDAFESIDSLASRLERDDSFAPGLAATTVTLGVVTIFLSYGLIRLGRREAALRVAQGAVLILPGWVVAIFVPTGRWYLRSLVVLAATLLGASLRPRAPLRTMAKIGLVSAIGFAVLAAVAPLNPGGEPGLSIWGNPLVSWRFFGLQNVEAAIIASGAVIWGALAGLAAPVLAAIAVAAAVVTGAPTIGANFVGVLTFVFGAAVVTIALARRRTDLGQVLIAGVIGVAAFVLALLADAGSPVSHGGRAARKISSGGASAAWDLVEGRLRLNWELIRDFGGGILWVIGLAISIGMLIRWGMRAELGPFRGRVAVLGGGLMALSSLVLEDSGFYSGAVLWFVTADAWLLITLAGEGSGVIPSESDAPLAGVGAGTRPPQPGEARRSRSSRD